MSKNTEEYMKIRKYEVEFFPQEPLFGIKILNNISSYDSKEYFKVKGFELGLIFITLYFRIVDYR